MRAPRDPRGSLERTVRDLHRRWRTEGDGSFVTFLIARHRETHLALRRSLDILEGLPWLVRRDWRRLRRRPIGEQTLAELMPHLAARFLKARRGGETAPFEVWYRELIRTHRTAKALRTFLGAPRAAPAQR